MGPESEPQDSFTESLGQGCEDECCEDRADSLVSGDSVVSLEPESEGSPDFIPLSLQEATIGIGGITVYAYYLLAYRMLSVREAARLAISMSRLLVSLKTNRKQENRQRGKDFPEA